ncbi:hypothetical protein LCGC14_2558530 [marine sediment metagenome]|uniref:MOFRL domain-containing protein n=1 Tax=marine sediment metagenome TaxID=412755 RepID=A0A0F9AKP4_9ZZZZ
MTTETHKIAEDIFRAALKGADPFAGTVRYSALVLDSFVSGGYEKLSYLAFGKAAPRMAQALEATAGDTLRQGLVVTGYDNAAGFASRLASPACVMEAGHPVPDKAGAEAASRAIELALPLGRDDLLVCLVSGGGSALLASPAEGITLEDKQEITLALLRSGADITEINIVRKHLSKIKGGRLAALAHPAGVISLIVSDVVGDAVENVASGPTSPDTSTYADAGAVMKKYRITPPDNVMGLIESGINGKTPETPKPEDPVFQRVENIISTRNRSALDGAFNRALELGLMPDILTGELAGDVSYAAQWLAGKAREKKSAPACIISGGETTVRVTGSGMGGRNMELALWFALEIEGEKGITLLSAGTDGSDGGTEAAGAIVDGKTARRARRKGINPEAYLKNNDSYNFFRKAGGLVTTGPTGTNVMDVQVMVIS